MKCETHARKKPVGVWVSCLHQSALLLLVLLLLLMFAFLNFNQQSKLTPLSGVMQLHCLNVDLSLFHYHILLSVSYACQLVWCSWINASRYFKFILWPADGNI